MEATIDLMHSACTWKKHRSSIKLSRDTKDDFLLGFSINCKAHYLISYDNDVLILKEINGTKIIDFRTFLEKLDKRQL